MTSTTTSTSTKTLPQIIKGNADWREYHAIELQNGVQCIFVHDRESKTTACSVCVGAGASADPRVLSGLAHFTEHMCFLGSEAYPVENEFKKYLSSHGGRSNASTSMSQTVYKFDILSDHALKAIDIFSNFFISPLFTQSGTAREVNAVDSENSKNMSNDGRRRLQILKDLANPNHHYSKFSTGNAKTLAMDCESDVVSTDETKSTRVDERCGADDSFSGVDLDTVEARTEFVREALLAFHRRHYRPDNMIVVVVGPQSIETLQGWIVPRFAAIVNRWGGAKNESKMSKAELLVESAAKDAPNDAFGSPPVPYDSPFDTKYQSNNWPIMLTTLPLQSVRKMYIYFPLPSVLEFLDESPYHVICHLLGHEGPGSCFAFLQDTELIDGISVGPRLSEIDYSLLQIDISLTEKGEEHWESVVQTVFDYCRLMYDTLKKAKEVEQKDGDNESNNALDELMRIWDEIKMLKSLRFNQTSPGQAIALAPYLAGSVRKNGTARSLSAGSLIDRRQDKFPLDNVLDFLEKMVPQNCFIERCSHSAWDQTKQNNVPVANIDGMKLPLFGLKKEKWYGVDYFLSDIDRMIVDKWNWKCGEIRNALLHLPCKNSYIPTDLSLCADLPENATKQPRIEKPVEPPNLIQENDFGRLWHRLDDRYCLPKASLTILFRNPAVQNKWDAESESWTFHSDAEVQSSILLDTFSDALAQITYDAELAGLQWSLNKTASGLVLKCSGYSQHLTKFASHLLEQFFDKKATFINVNHVRTNKDRMIRYLESFLTSKRADSYASYYSNLLVSSQGQGIEHSLALAKQVSLKSILAHHRHLINVKLNKIECLISGNLSKQDAETFFTKAHDILSSNQSIENFDCGTDSTRRSYCEFIPGPFERALIKSEDIHLHFQSLNPEEQNGAVRMQFQSSIPGFTGLDIDSPLSEERLIHTAALRLICHMLREPLFNQLRTKEQLGYIVNSYYDLDFASQRWKTDQSLDHKNSFATVAVDSIVVNVLSHKFPPPVLTRRIDEFLDSFRETLLNMKEQEFINYKDALRENMLKPIQKLDVEVEEHFSKIRRFGPQVLDQSQSDDTTSTLPWDAKTHLAMAIKELDQKEVLNAWDNVVAGKNCRVVSHIYGSTFKMDTTLQNYSSSAHSYNLGRNTVHIHSTSGIFAKRKLMHPFGSSYRTLYSPSFKSIVNQIGQKKFVIGVAAGTSLIVYALNSLWGQRQGSRHTAIDLPNKKT